MVSRHTKQGLKEATDTAYYLVYFHDAVDGVFLFVEVARIDWNIAECFGGTPLSQYLDGTDGVEHDGVDFAVLDVVNGTFTEGDYISVADAWFHGVARDVTPYTGFFKSRYHDVTRGECCLVVKQLNKPTVKIYIVIWRADSGVISYNFF